MTFSPSSYNLGASLVSIGLLWWHGMIAAVIGSAILTLLVILNSRGAIKYFIGFPVYVRAAAGVRGASLYILVRAVVAIIYFATQTYYGGRIMSVFMRGIFGNGYNNITNRLPANAGITSRDLLSFFIFWMVSCFTQFSSCDAHKLSYESGTAVAFSGMIRLRDTPKAPLTTSQTFERMFSTTCFVC